VKYTTKISYVGDLWRDPDPEKIWWKGFCIKEIRFQLSSIYWTWQTLEVMIKGMLTIEAGLGLMVVWRQSIARLSAIAV
jgi:hypothetical protein